MATPVRNIAPFINDIFYVTSEWWTIRDGKLHRGLDIATSGSKPVYSILDGYVFDLGTDSTRGNWIMIRNPNNGYTSLYMHLAERPLLVKGQNVSVGTYIAMEGSTGTSTGIHLHVEMQIIPDGGYWIISDNKSDYLDPTLFMGIDNIKNTSWIYSGEPRPIPTSRRNHFKFWIYRKNKNSMI